MPATALKETPIGKKVLCGFCGAEIVWRLTVDNGRVPVYDADRTDGMLCLNAEGKLERASLDDKRIRFRSHFLDCKPLAYAYADRNKVKLAQMGPPVIPCEREDCDRTDKHFHCFACGSTEHLASQCEEEKVIAELNGEIPWRK